MTETILFKDESYAIQGAIFEVYREMGCGFLEPVYQECLEKELQLFVISNGTDIHARSVSEVY